MSAEIDYELVDCTVVIFNLKCHLRLLLRLKCLFYVLKTHYLSVFCKLYIISLINVNKYAD